MVESASALTLGFDLSTQSLKVIALDSSLNVVFRSQVNFDIDLPHYKTTMGAHFKANNQVSSPVFMFVEALDLLLSQMKSDSFPFHKVIGISGSGQQHGSVYWTLEGKKVLEELKEDKTLLQQFQSADSFSLKDCPIWMDNSTTKNCRELEEHLKGASNLVMRTGSRAYERFTGNQIAKIFKENRQVYEETVHISLISSFVAEILLGHFSHIDYSDGSGMNLLNLKTKTWDPEICEFIACDLPKKLDLPVPSHNVLGKIGTYFVKRYNFPEDCLIIAFSGDNPNSLVGVGIFDKDDICISLGTSDTIFGLASASEKLFSMEGHVFISPVDPDLYFIMICTKNGSVVRERVKQEYASNNWDSFGELLKQTPQGNNGCLCLFYEHPEIVPYIEASEVKLLFDKEGKKLDALSGGNIVRGCIEGKIIALKYHAEQKGLVSKSNGKIFITGGGSKNRDILQIVADVFQKEVSTIQVEDSAALGAALRALHGYKCNVAEKWFTFKNVFPEFLSKRDKNLNIIKPDESLKNIYEELAKLYEKFLIQLPK